MTSPDVVLAFAPNWLGDGVMALPALADLRRHHPRARLVVAGRPSVAALFEMVPGIDEVLTLSWRGSVWRAAQASADVRALRATRARVAVLFPNSFASAWLAWRAGIAERWGYARDRRSWMLTRAVPRPVPAVHQGRYYQRLVAAAGIPNGPLEPMLEPPADARVSAETLLRDRGWDGRAPLVVVAPGAAYGTAKQWPVPHVRTLVSGLVSEGRVCVLVGSRADAPTTAAVREGLDAGAGRQVIDTAGETSLPVLAALLSLAGVCVANDSGAMHLAGALGVPVVAVFGPTNEHETAPLTRRGRTATVLTAPVWCRPCMLRTCPLDHRCMQRVEPARVRDAVDRALTARVEPR